VATLIRRRGSRRWTVRFYDEHGIRRDVATETADRRVAERIRHEIEARCVKIKAGLLDPREERRAKEEQRPLSEHIDDWRRYLVAKGNTTGHVDDNLYSVKKVVHAIKAERISDLTPAKVQEQVGEIRSKRSARTANKYLVAVKAFSRWLLRDGRVITDVLTGLCGYNVATDRRRRRRALTVDELRALFAAAEGGREFRGLSGPQRSMLYRIAVGTGFRAGEIAALTTADFALEAEPPTITVPAAYSKHRREDVQPIRQDLADYLRARLFGRSPKSRIFNVRALADNTSDMIRRDLEVAGVAHATDDGIADFHALRHTFITQVVAAGASIHEARKLARHSSPEITFRVYTHARLEDLSRTLASLPTIEGPSIDSAAVRRTGTDEATVHGPPNGPLSSQKMGNSGKHRESNRGASAKSGEREKPGVGTRITTAFAQRSMSGLARPAGIEPATAGLEIRGTSSQRSRDRGLRKGDARRPTKWPTAPAGRESPGSKTGTGVGAHRAQPSEGARGYEEHIRSPERSRTSFNSDRRLLRLLEVLAGERERTCDGPQAANCAWCGSPKGRHREDCDLIVAVSRLRPASCADCGCTELDACLDVDGAPCSWFEPPGDGRPGRCSACAGSRRKGRR
jgi:integrase